MLFRTYMFMCGIASAFVALLGFIFLFVAASTPASGALVALGIFLLAFAPLGFVGTYVIIRGQLDRHEGSVPMPGIWGAIFDIDDDEFEGSAGSSRPDYDSNELPAEPARDPNRVQVLATCPRCGARTLRDPGAPCEVCGYRFALDLLAASSSRVAR